MTSLFHPNEVRPLLKIAGPIAVAQLANNAMQIVDSVFAGKLGPQAIGAISLGNAVFATIMVVCIGLLAGLDFWVSKSFGAKKYEAAQEYLVQSLYISIGVSLFFTALLIGLSRSFDAFGIEPSLAQGAGVYLRRLCWSLTPFCLFMSFRNYLQGFSIATAPMIILLFANLVNALCNWLFVFGNWGFDSHGVAGSGMATVVARWFMVSCVIVYLMFKKNHATEGLFLRSFQFQLKKTRDLLKLGWPVALQLLVEVGAFAGATLLAGRLGATALSAHQIVLHLASLTFMVSLGISVAAAVRVGQAIGAEERHRVPQIGWTALFLGAFIMGGFGLIFFLVPSPILGIFTQDVGVLSAAKGLLLLAALFQICDGLQVVATGTLRGVGNTQTALWANVFGHWMVGVPLGVILCFSLKVGIQGLWIGLSLGLVVVSSVLVLFWRKVSKKYEKASIV